MYNIPQYLQLMGSTVVFARQAFNLMIKGGAKVRNLHVKFLVYINLALANI